MLNTKLLYSKLSEYDLEENLAKECMDKLSAMIQEYKHRYGPGCIYENFKYEFMLKYIEPPKTCVELVTELKKYEKLRDEDAYLRFHERAPGYFPSQVAIIKTEPYDWNIDNLDYLRKYSKDGVISQNDNLFWSVYIAIYPCLHTFFEKSQSSDFYHLLEEKILHDKEFILGFYNKFIKSNVKLFLSANENKFYI